MAIGHAWRMATGRRKSARQTTDAPEAEGDPIARLTWYEATRHSFASRNLSRGASLDEVSDAIGHSSPVVTRRYYDHYIRRTFSEGLRQGLGLTDGTGNAAPVVPLRPRPGSGENGGTDAGRQAPAQGAHGAAGVNGGTNGEASERKRRK